MYTILEKTFEFVKFFMIWGIIVVSILVIIKPFPHMKQLWADLKRHISSGIMYLECITACSFIILISCIDFTKNMDDWLRFEKKIVASMESAKTIADYSNPVTIGVGTILSIILIANSDSEPGDDFYTLQRVYATIILFSQAIKLISKLIRL